MQLAMRKKSIFLVILAFATLSLTGQNLVKADYKPIHFGFTLGINAMDFGITPSLMFFAIAEAEPFAQSKATFLPLNDLVATEIR